MSRNTPLVSYPLSKDLQIACVIHNGWLIHESVFSNPHGYEKLNRF